MKTIDLHGFRHKDASDKVCRLCSEYDGPFVVITGRSQHMKKIVLAVVKNYGLTARETIGNPGRMIIDESR